MPGQQAKPAGCQEVQVNTNMSDASLVADIYKGRSDQDKLSCRPESDHAPVLGWQHTFTDVQEELSPCKPNVL